jgi:hypothetical protein
MSMSDLCTINGGMDTCRCRGKRMGVGGITPAQDTKLGWGLCRSTKHPPRLRYSCPLCHGSSTSFRAVPNYHRQNGLFSRNAGNPCSF